MKSWGLALCLVFFSIGLQAQSKKELKERLAYLENQVDQLKRAVVKLSSENKELKEQDEGSRTGGKPVRVQYERCEKLWDTIEEQKQQIRQLEEELYRARLSRAERILPDSFKRSNFKVANNSLRKQLEVAYFEHYLSNCLRMNNIQRLFSEDAIIEFEVNPVTHDFAGFIRHRYTPDMGKDEYTFQRIAGTYRAEGDFKYLQVIKLDGRSVDILIRYQEDRELYNEITASEADLAMVKTHHGSIKEFGFSRCR